MCTGLELLAPILGSALSVGGTVMQQQEQQRMANQQAKARNDALEATLLKNRKIAEQSRDEFSKRIRQSDDKSFKNQQSKSTRQRSAELKDAVKSLDETAPEEGASITGSAPTIVGSDLAKRMQSVLAEGKTRAEAQGKLGAYGDTWLKQGFMDTNAGRNVGVLTNKASGNSAILPYSQDFAEWRATKPLSPIGQILTGLGGAVGSWAGSQTNPVLPRQTYTSPFIG